MKMTTIAAIAVSILSINAAAVAEVSKKDQAFITKAAEGGMFEVQAGKLAQSNGQSDGVKSYGAMLVKDHSAANDELKGLAEKKGAKLPTNTSRDHQNKLDKLAKAKSFDQEFVKEVGIKDHKTDIALFEKASKSADDVDVKAFAAKTLPALQAHREHAEGLQKGAKR